MTKDTLGKHILKEDYFKKFILILSNGFKMRNSKIDKETYYKMIFKKMNQ
jgi:hypothetical protein